MSKKRVLVFTGTRAEYGLLHPLLVEMLATNGMKPTLLIGGEHFWNTASFTEAQSLLPLNHRVLMPLREGHALQEASLAQRALAHEAACSRYIETSKNSYDALVVLGDRYEAMAMAMAAFYHDIPIIQLAAGDRTEGGCPDDRLRFALTALAKGVVCFSEASAQRVRQMGLHDAMSILKTSSLSVDNVRAVPEIPKEILLRDLNIEPTAEFVLFTQHPVPSESLKAVDHFQASLEGLRVLKDRGVHVIATTSNADAMGDELRRVIEQSKQQDAHIHWVDSLGVERYLNALRHAMAVVGNSSSGLYESPLFGTPCISIGPRQAGRERATNVTDIPYGKDVLVNALEVLLQQPRHKLLVDSPFGNTAAAPQIMSFLQRLLV